MGPLLGRMWRLWQVWTAAAPQRHDDWNGDGASAEQQQSRPGCDSGTDGGQKGLRGAAPIQLGAMMPISYDRFHESALARAPSPLPGQILATSLYGYQSSSRSAVDPSSDAPLMTAAWVMQGWAASAAEMTCARRDSTAHGSRARWQLRTPRASAFAYVSSQEQAS